jgi:hypothetical protein
MQKWSRRRGEVSRRKAESVITEHLAWIAGSPSAARSGWGGTHSDRHQPRALLPPATAQCGVAAVAAPARCRSAQGSPVRRTSAGPKATRTCPLRGHEVARRAAAAGSLQHAVPYGGEEAGARRARRDRTLRVRRPPLSILRSWARDQHGESLRQVSTRPLRAIPFAVGLRRGSSKRKRKDPRRSR